jgi:hypothetical protein
MNNYLLDESHESPESLCLLARVRLTTFSFFADLLPHLAKVPLLHLFASLPSFIPLLHLKFRCTSFLDSVKQHVSLTL